MLIAAATVVSSVLANLEQTAVSTNGGCSQPDQPAAAFRIGVTSRATATEREAEKLHTTHSGHSKLDCPHMLAGIHRFERNSVVQLDLCYHAV